MRFLVALTLIVSAAACASAPPPVVVQAPPPEPPPPPPPSPTFDEKQKWIPRLEDLRILRDEAIAVDTLPSPAFQPDLIALLADPDSRLRRRAAQAVGRVGLRAGVQPLVARLADEDVEVRRTSAFALGLIADREARDPLVRALDDPSPAVQASAAQALGLIGDAAASTALGDLAARLVGGGITISEGADDEHDTPAAVLRETVYALARLKAAAPLMAAVLDDNGQPRLRWWPIVYALQRVEDSKTLPALRALVRDPHANTRFFAIKGLGVLRDRSATTLLLPLVGQADQRAALEAVRALGRIGDRAAVEPLIDVVISEAASPTLRVEAIASLGAIGGEGVTDLLIDLFSNRSAALRAAAIQALAALDPFSFVAVLSGFELDRDWTVRVALARALGTQTPEAGLPRLRLMLTEQDQRVIPAVLDALEKLRAPEIMDVALKRLGADDPAVRTAAARIIERLKPAQGAAALAAAYQFGERDATYIARAAALTAIAAYGAGDATPVLTTALKDPDWAVRRRAATLLGQLDPSSQADARIRPAPTHLTREVYEAPRVLAPTVSPHAYIDTDRGTIQIELDVVEAPLTVENFVGLARRGFFDGLAVHRVVPNFVIQTGDPRGDSEGGPGYSIRDELNQRSYLRGTVGMALDWADTGGSQFFITLMPQPQLDAAYTAFGRVISGMEAADRLVAGDVVRRIRIWDGTSP